MKARHWRRVSMVAFAVSAAFLVFSLVMTQVRVPQTMIINGPAYSYGGYSSTLSAYITPPVSAGSQFTLTVVNAPKDTLDISVFPTEEGTIVRVGPIAIESNIVGAGFTSQFTSPSLLAYAIWVVSYNNANFTIRVDGTWTPFYVLNTYIVPAAFATFASGIALYYYSYTSKREKVEEEAIASATRGRP